MNKTFKTSIKITGNLTKHWNEYFLNISLQHYYYTNLYNNRTWLWVLENGSKGNRFESTGWHFAGDKICTEMHISHCQCVLKESSPYCLQDQEGDEIATLSKSTFKPNYSLLITHSFIKIPTCNILWHSFKL